MPKTGLNIVNMEIKRPILDKRKFNQNNFLGWLCGDTNDFSDCWKDKQVPWKKPIEKYVKPNSTKDI